jgi:hypothetical protein
MQRPELVPKRGCFRSEMRIRPVSSISNNNSDSTHWDPSSLQLDPSAFPPAPLATRRGRRVSPIKNKFIKGPVDFAWLSAAQKLGVTALWLGLCLWFLRGLKGSDSFLVSNIVAQEWGLLPDAKSRALRKLEMARLIAIERRGKRSPRVTLVLTNSTPNQKQGEPA